MKKLVFNAANFGQSHDTNRAVLNGSNNGFLRCAGIIANGEAFEAAINEILPECPLVDIGICLNITSGKPFTNCEDIIDRNKVFNKNFCSLNKLVKHKKILKEIEKEFRAQLDKIPSSVKISYIDSVEKVHLIPEIFELVCKLAAEYNIKYIVTYREPFYLSKDITKWLNPKIFINFIKFVTYNVYSFKNIKVLKSYGLKTNDYSIGTLYKGLLDKNLLENILKSFEPNDLLVNAQLFPCSYLRDINNSCSQDFKLTQDKILEDNINRIGFDISGYR